MPYDIITFDKYISAEDNFTYDGKILNVDKKVKRGELLLIEVSYNKKYDLPAIHLNRYLISNGNITIISNIRTNFPVGKNKSIVSVLIPYNTPYKKI